MSYSYAVERAALFTDDGQRMFLRARDHVRRLLTQSGAVRMQEAMAGAGSGNSWTMLACIDRLAELGELREITPEGRVAGQHRVFVAAEALG